MSRISGKNTKPELVVRSVLHHQGYRFRIHRNDLPGKPDIVLTKYKKVIFVHGCFWHGHIKCNRSKRPTTNIKFWHNKIEKNIERDKTSIADLKKLGWLVLVIWTCEIRDRDLLKYKLIAFLEDKKQKYAKEI